MIVSHKHKFIYIKTYKTASSSIETALSNLLGDEDIITPARSDLQEQRLESRQAQNFRLDHPAVPKRSLFRRLLGRPERFYHPTVGFYEHMPAWRVRTYLGDEIWNEYYKFTFERNPWDRQISFFHYKTRERSQSLSFDCFLRNRRKSYIENFDLYSINDEIILDFIGEYENLEKDFQQILRHIGLDEKITLPITNVGIKSSSKSYRDYYDDKSRQLIGDWYAREIEHFGYTF